MFDLLNSFVQENLLPQRQYESAFEENRARLLVYIHLMALGGAVMFTLADLIIKQAMLGGMFVFMSAVLALLIVFRRFGNIVLSGNLLVALVAGVLLQTILETGGLYSDNLLWLLLVPITAFLFASRRWGIVWSGLLLSALATVYLLEISAPESYRYASLEFGASYYFISYLGLFCGVLGVILIFVRSNDDTLEALHATTHELRAQQAQTAAQNLLLKQQEADLTRSNRDLELFAYVASHDLKEPLRMVNAYSQLLQRNVAVQLPLREQEYLGFVRDGATRMQVMLDDLLDYSKLGRERSQIEKIDLNRTLSLVRNNLRTRLDETGGTLNIGELPSIEGRSTQLIQIFQNLIVNGLKFHREAQAPVISVSAKPSADGHWEVAISDNGIGIRPEDQQRIFGVFQRLHAVDKFEGSGIGLATVKRILEGMDAQIEVDSQVDRGSTFTIRFADKAESYVRSHLRLEGLGEAR